MAQIALDGARIDAVIRQLVAAAMPQHVRVNFHVKVRRADRAAGEQIPRWRLVILSQCDSPKTVRFPISIPTVQSD